MQLLSLIKIFHSWVSTLSWEQLNINQFTKRHRLVHDGGFPKFEAVYCSPSVGSSTEIS